MVPLLLPPEGQKEMPGLLPPAMPRVYSAGEITILQAMLMVDGFMVLPAVQEPIMGFIPRPVRLLLTRLMALTIMPTVLMVRLMALTATQATMQQVMLMADILLSVLLEQDIIPGWLGLVILPLLLTLTVWMVMLIRALPAVLLEDISSAIPAAPDLSLALRVPGREIRLDPVMVSTDLLITVLPAPLLVVIFPPVIPAQGLITG